MRRGEILALEWSDLDFSNNSISITKSTTIANGKPITKTPKTKASIRKISVPAFLMELARNYRREQLQYRLSLGSEWVGEIMSLSKQMESKCIPIHLIINLKVSFVVIMLILSKKKRNCQKSHYMDYDIHLLHL